MRGMWKRSYGQATKAPPDERGGNTHARPNATASHPHSTRAYIGETDLGKIAYGMRAKITTDSFPGQIYRGWIGYISPAAEFTPKTVETTTLRTALVYQLRVYVCDSRNQLRLGMPATVQIDLSGPTRKMTQAGTACGPGDGATQ